MSTKEKFADAGKRMLLTLFWTVAVSMVVLMVVRTTLGFWVPFQLLVLLLAVNLPLFFILDISTAFSRKTLSKGWFRAMVIVVVAELVFVGAVLYTPLGKMLTPNQVGITFLVIPTVLCVAHFILEKVKK